MTYDEMETAIAKARDGADAMKKFVEADSELHDAITPDTAANIHLLCETMGDAINGLAQMYESEEFVEEFVRRLTNHAMGEILLQYLGSHVNGDPDMYGTTRQRFGTNTTWKVAGVEVADVIGPDWAQALYHFAVFTTRVA